MHVIQYSDLVSQPNIKIQSQMEFASNKIEFLSSNTCGI